MMILCLYVAIITHGSYSSKNTCFFDKMNNFHSNVDILASLVAWKVTNTENTIKKLKYENFGGYLRFLEVKFYSIHLISFHKFREIERWQ